MIPLILRALNGEPCERAPVWLMRQAGRYMEEYRSLKAKHGFLGLCRSPELACEVTLQPIRAFRPDAAIIFADILLPAEGLGFDIDFNPGPKIGNPIRSRNDVTALKDFDPYTSTRYVLDALGAAKRALQSGHPETALLGFAGTPWTMACYLIDQGPFKHFLGTQVFAAQEPEAMKLLLETLSDCIADYLAAQLESGADAVQLFDSWGGNLSAADYRRYSLPYIRRIVERIKPIGKPIILYTNGGSHLLEASLEAETDCISIDSRTELSAALTAAGAGVAVQGNLDPTHLFGSKDALIDETRTMLCTVDRKSGYIANLGHGILPTTPPENVAAFIETVKEGW